MAVTQISLDSPAGYSRYVNTVVNNAISGVKTSAGTIHALIIDNTANAAITYIKLYHALTGSVTVGTTAPDDIIAIPASVKRTISFVEGLGFLTGLSVAAVTAGGTGGTTSPTSSVILTVEYV